MHNFETGGASPDDAVANRQIDRFYHAELYKAKDDKLWVIFSISGDSFLRGQVHINIYLHDSFKSTIFYTILLYCMHYTI